MADERVLEKREAILDAAEKVFDAHGYAAATVDAVAKEAGIAKGSIYNYFRSKHELFWQVFARVLSGAEADTDRLVGEGLSASEKLERLLDYWSERLGYHTRIGRLVLECWATAAREERDGQVAATFQRLYSRSRDLLGAILAEGARSGEFARQFDTPAAVSLILALLDGIEIQSILDMGLTVDDAFLKAVKQVILLGLKAGTHSTQ